MEPRDCSWCGSARSIEYGVCQVCLMRFPDRDAPRVISLDPVEEVEADRDAADAAVAD